LHLLKQDEVNPDMREQKAAATAPNTTMSWQHYSKNMGNNMCIYTQYLTSI